jgi:type III secretory pathway component EscT
VKENGLCFVYSETTQLLWRSVHLSLPARIAAILADLSCFLPTVARAADKKIVLLAGSASHGSGEHEFNAGVSY